MAQSMFDLFETETPLIGMVHLKPLPGSMAFAGDFEGVVESGLRDAAILERAGFDGIVVENMGDKPYAVGRVSLDQVVCMAVIVREIAKQVSIPVGVNMQFNVVREEAVIARWCGARFIRVEVLTDTVLTPAGVCRPSCDLLADEMRKWQGRNPMIFADVQVKETIMAHPVSLRTSCEWVCDSKLALALIVTGEGTGKATPLEKVDVAKEVSGLPVLVGSGVTVDTVWRAFSINLSQPVHHEDWHVIHRRNKNMERTTYIKCSSRDLASSIILVGDPARVDRIAALLDAYEEPWQNREFRVVTGAYRDTRVSVVSSGIGAASAAIAICELACLGVTKIVRVGTMMGVSCPLGYVALPISAARYDEVSNRYLDPYYPAVADFDLVMRVSEGLKEAGQPYSLGVSASFSDFYGEMAPQMMKHYLENFKPQSDGCRDIPRTGSSRETPKTPEHVKMCRQLGVLGFDMESALVLAASMRFGIRAMSACLVTVPFDAPGHFLEEDVKARREDKLVTAILNALREEEPVNA